MNQCTTNLQVNQIKSSEHFVNPIKHMEMEKRRKCENEILFYDLSVNEDYCQSENAMKKVASRVKMILKETPKDGRQMYLQKRYCEKPKDKYHYPVSTSWRYGWNV